MNASSPTYPFDLGRWTRRITTSSAEAQKWFDRGLNWTYGYNQEEAVTCFRHALDHDPNCAMAQWGVALAHGPFYNRPWVRFSEGEIDDTLPVCHAAAQRALAQMERCSPAEQGLIKAIALRYQNADTRDLAVLNTWHCDYVDEMRKVHAAYPKDMDIAALFVEAAVTRTPRQLWDLQTGAPKASSDIVEAAEVLEQSLKFCADQGILHPGLNHMNIHSFEMSPMPEQALGSANHLCDLLPDAGHLQHMPAHIYMLLGDFVQAVDQSEHALRANDKYLAHAGARNFYTTARCHDVHLLMYAAMFLGNFGKSLAAADRIVAEATPELIAWAPPYMGTILDGYAAMRIHVLVRFGKWQTLAEITELPDPALTPIKAAMLAYGQCVAHAALGNFDAAESAQQRFHAICDTIPSEAVFLSNPVGDMLNVGRSMMAGELAYHWGDHTSGFAYLRDAVARDDALNYTEPWAWMHPPRHALGALLAEQGHFEDAAEIFRQDLGLVPGVPRPAQHPNNIWAMRGLLECVEQIGTKAQAQDLRAKLESAQNHADHTISAACCCRNQAGAAHS